MISNVVDKFFDLVFFILFITILLTWFPKINWYNQPFKAMKDFSEVFLSPFRRIIPPIGMIDISPIIAFICLGLMRNAILYLLNVFKIN